MLGKYVTVCLFALQKIDEMVEILKSNEDREQIFGRPGLVPLARLDENKGQYDVIRKFVGELLSKLVSSLTTRLPLESTTDQVRRLDELVQNGAPFKEVKTAVLELKNRMHDELDKLEFFFVKRDSIEYYSGKFLLGKGFEDKIDSAREDIAEAGKCLALGRTTATVFHLMRVMELAVQRLAIKLNISINTNVDSWNDIMGRVQTVIKAMPRGDEKATMAACATHLDLVRIAWRNEVMHPKQTYTEEEARDIFNAVKTFARELEPLI